MKKNVKKCVPRDGGSKSRNGKRDRGEGNQRTKQWLRVIVTLIVFLALMLLKH